MADNNKKSMPKGLEVTADVILGIYRVLGKALKWILGTLGTILTIGIVTGVMFALIFVMYCRNYLVDDMEPVDLDDFQLNESSFIYCYDKESEEWEVLQELYFEKRTWVSYEELPSYVFDALVAIEDHRYWSHSGVDWYRTLGAAYTIFLGDGSTFGGSTITQQVVKNMTGNRDVTVRRKLGEIFQAIDVDTRYSKEDILEVYMNLVYFGQGCYGIEAAAQTYFGKPASELTLPEAASIVGITNLPTYYDPYQNRDNNKDRQEDILYRMWELEYIDEETYREAKETKLVFKRDVTSNSSSTNRAKIQSYFVDQVIEDVIADLMVEKGVSYRIAEQYLFTGGYQIYMTMDTDVQAIIDEVYTNPEYWPELRDADELEQPPQSAIVVLDPATGNVLGMYGGLGEKTTNRAKNRAAQMTKQPGSSIKPLAVYAPALDAGLIGPYDVYTDMPAMLDGNNNAYPKNYDRVYRGEMTIMEAVQRSNNTIPVRLVNTMGPEYCFEFAKYNMGLSTLVEGEYRGEQYFTDAAVASMALGGLTDGVTVVDMAAAYAVFPNAGVYNEPKTYLQVLDSSGEVVLEHESTGTAVIKESTAFYMNNLLTNVITNGTGVNAKLTNSIAAGKTGTTDDDYDRWFVGYTPHYSCAVWYGFDYNHTINPVSGTSPAVPLWQTVMDRLHENIEPTEFFTPATSDVVKVSYCRDSGKLASDACRADLRGSRVLTGTFLAEDMPTEVCSLHQYVDVCSESQHLAGEFCPAEGIVRAAMLNTERYFELPNIALQDEGYTLRDLSVDYTQPTDFGYRVIAATASPANTLCNLHVAPEEPVDPNDDPNAGEFPTEPVDPNDPNAPVDPNAPSAEPSAPTTAEPSVPPSTTPSTMPSDDPIEDYPEEVSPPPEFPTEPDDEPTATPSTEASFVPATT